MGGGFRGGYTPISLSNARSLINAKQMFMYKGANALHLRSLYSHFFCSFFIYIIISKFLAIYKVDMIIIILIEQIWKLVFSDIKNLCVGLERDSGQASESRSSGS